MRTTIPSAVHQFLAATHRLFSRRKDIKITEVELNSNIENIFIAEGRGIIPFLSLLRAGKVAGKTMLFYCTNSELDAVYNAELKALSAKFGFRYFLHESDRRGFITTDIIEKRANGLAEKNIYLCGPGNMMADLTKKFIAKGVPRKNIFFESFSY
jgi:stearoyl-CoA 9-desaturase NADPH oxidoreductase